MTALKYRTIESATNNELLEFNKIRNKSRYRPNFHITPPHGLLNDPNGFCFYNGQYHLFYQWYPYGTFHGLKHWMHLTSIDLINWNEEGCKIIPNESYESHGAYSGAAFIEDDHAYLFYTGNVKQDNERDANQCMALLGKTHSVEKHVDNPVIQSVPQGYTGHVRDPKIVKHQDSYYMLLGAQKEEPLQGCIIVYQSSDLLDWTYIGELTIESDADFSNAYMFECPDLLKVDGQDVLIFSPQGLTPQGDRFQNRYNVVYCIGKVDWEQLSFKVQAWDELDRGFDFYAPQTMANSPDDPTLIAWAGTDEKLPSQQQGWVNTLTLPRQLTIRDDRLYQMPVDRVGNLNRTSIVNEKISRNVVDGKSQNIKVVELDSLSFELNLTSLTGGAEISIESDEGEKLLFTIDGVKKELKMDRTLYDHNDDSWGFSPIRKTTNTEEINNVKMIVDQSIIEVFANQGRDVFTSLFFPKETKHYLKISLEEQSEVDINLQYLTI
ncbi:sucrose-6-phosphate hydrolase [uncultured Vibrio sp.]|uniref:glycoside hydrolase family 32 protein n=1 Tax=uncultured Vibrio sp. TaxID=114054 RepID=UPI0025ECBF09|nr:sucrose-6-phosphate hydrolase [uncultured Vibrio sp.]